MSKNENRWSPKRLARELIVFVVVLFVVSTLLDLYRAPKLSSDTIPDINATLVDGSRFDSAKYDGKPIMINFWGTWCPVCATEATNIDSVSKKYTVLTIAVNSGSDESIERWMREHDVTYPILNDASGEWAKRFGVSVYPTTFIYDGTGQLKFTLTGYSTTIGLISRMKLAE